MDTITLAGPLEAKLRAVRDGGFTQVMLSARDIVGHPGGEQAAIDAVRASGLRVTGFQVLRDFEGLSGDLHAYKIDIAKSMLTMCHALGSRVLLCCSTTSAHADRRPRPLRRRPAEAGDAGDPVPHPRRVRGAVVGTLRQRRHRRVGPGRARRSPNLGLAIDSYHMLATGTPVDALEDIDPRKVLFVQLADFMWQATPTADERRETARHFRVFPGEGVHRERRLAVGERRALQRFNDVEAIIDGDNVTA